MTKGWVLLTDGARRSCAALVMAMVCAACLGCAALKTPGARILPAEFEDRLQTATIVYRHQVPRTEQADGDTRPTSIQVLSIKYPHPDGPKDQALAELIVTDAEGEKVESPDTWLAKFSSFARDALPGVALGRGIQQAKSLAIERSSVQDILRQLAEQGYFDRPYTSQPQATLATELNGASSEKQWSSVPELERLANRVRTKGRIISCRQLAISASEPIALYLAQAKSGLQNRPMPIAASSEECSLPFTPPLEIKRLPRLP